MKVLACPKCKSKNLKRDNFGISNSVYSTSSRQCKDCGHKFSIASYHKGGNDETIIPYLKTSPDGLLVLSDNMNVVAEIDAIKKTINKIVQHINQHTDEEVEKILRGEE
jgi:transposase-like protein